MKVTRIEGDRPSVLKTVECTKDVPRISAEFNVLNHLKGSQIVPEILEYREGQSLEIEFIEGVSFQDWIAMDDWRCGKIPDRQIAMKRIGEYIALETKLLEAGVMYRDLNPAHLIFTGRGARIIDLEAALIKTPKEAHWILPPHQRGTWETMAPEEFTYPSFLTERMAVYRAAVIAHLTLTGKLPFEAHSKFSSRHTVVDQDLSKLVRKVLGASLQIQPCRRHKNPARLYEELLQSLEYKEEKS